MTESAVAPRHAVSVTVLDEVGDPVRDAHIVRVAANGTRQAERTGREGLWQYVEPFGGTLTFMVARAGYAPVLAVREARSLGEGLLLTTRCAPDGAGSVIFENGTGFVPGLEGRLDPIRDNLGRTYVYGDNLSFQDGPTQPHYFHEGVPFRVTDAVGHNAEVTVVGIVGRTSLIGYVPAGSTA